jgi:type II secretory pathway component PulF
VWGFFSFLFPPLMLVLPLIVMLLISLNIRRRRMILALFQNALETGTPLQDVLRAYANTCWGIWYRAKLIRFADRLQAGYSIVKTAMAVKGVLRYETVGLIKMGGTKVPVQLFAQTNEDAQQNGIIWEHSLFQFLWYYMYLPFLLFPVLFYLVAIVPKMEAIYRDFNIELPPVTNFVIYLSQIFFRYFYLFSPLLLLILFSPLFYFIFRSGILSWRPFGVRRMLRRRDSAQFLRLFAVGLELKKPIEEIIDVYTQVVPSAYLCRLGKHFNEQIAKGANWIELLQKMQWLSHGEAALLKSAVQADHIEAVLREVANSKEQRQRTSDNVTVQICSVVCVLLFGLFAAVASIAFFIPLIRLIDVLVATTF